MFSKFVFLVGAANAATLLPQPTLATGTATTMTANVSWLKYNAAAFAKANQATIKCFNCLLSGYEYVYVLTSDWWSNGADLASGHVCCLPGQYAAHVVTGATDNVTSCNIAGATGSNSLLANPTGQTWAAAKTAVLASAAQTFSSESLIANIDRAVMACKSDSAKCGSDQKVTFDASTTTKTFTTASTQMTWDDQCVFLIKSDCAPIVLTLNTAGMAYQTSSTIANINTLWDVTYYEYSGTDAASDWPKAAIALSATVSKAEAATYAGAADGMIGGQPFDLTYRAQATDAGGRNTVPASVIWAWMKKKEDEFAAYNAKETATAATDFQEKRAVWNWFMGPMAAKTNDYLDAGVTVVPTGSTKKVLPAKADMEAKLTAAPATSTTPYVYYMYDAAGAKKLLPEKPYAPPRPAAYTGPKLNQGTVSGAVTTYLDHTLQITRGWGKPVAGYLQFNAAAAVGDTKAFGVHGQGWANKVKSGAAAPYTYTASTAATNNQGTMYPKQVDYSSSRASCVATYVVVSLRGGNSANAGLVPVSGQTGAANKFSFIATAGVWNNWKSFDGPAQPADWGAKTTNAIYVREGAKALAATAAAAVALAATLY